MERLRRELMVTRSATSATRMTPTSTTISGIAKIILVLCCIAVATSTTEGGTTTTIENAAAGTVESSPVSNSQKKKEQSIGAIDNAVKEWMERNNVRGASIAFYDGSDPENIIDVRQGYGRISSDNDSEAVTADTAFQIASVSKVFVGTAVGVLLELGIIKSLDDDICDVTMKIANWSKLTCRHPTFPNVPITWRMFVTHRTSLVRDIPPAFIDNGSGFLKKPVLAQFAPDGLEFVPGVKAYGNPKCPLTNAQDFYRVVLSNEGNTSVGGDDIDWSDVLRRSSSVTRKESWLRFRRPGRMYHYSNHAFGYVAALVELATSRSFEDFCREYIFGPLLMNNTSWFRENLNTTTTVAMPVLFDPESNSYSDIGHYCYVNYACGQLYSSANDLSSFLRAMLSKGVPTLWSERVGEIVLSCQDGSAGLCAQQRRLRSGSLTTGLAWVLLDNSMKETRRGVFSNLGPLKDRYNWTSGGLHNGSLFGVSTVVFVLPSSNMYLAVLANVQFADVFDLAMKVIEATTTTK